MHPAHKDKWFVNELLIMCVQEEENLLMEEGGRVDLITFEKNKSNQVNHKEKIPAQPMIKESKVFLL